MDEISKIDLFRGLAVLIDDAFGRESDDTIRVVRDALVDMGIIVQSYDRVPPEKDRESLAMASLIIIDWELGNSSPEQQALRGQGVSLGTSINESNNAARNEFIKWALREAGVPIVVFSAQGTWEAVQSALEYPESRASRLFVTHKGDLDRKIVNIPQEKRAERVTEIVTGWFAQDHGLYALKVWEHAAHRARREMFRDFDDLSSRWTDILWGIACDDCPDDNGGVAYDAVRLEFGDLITRNVENRMTEFAFDNNVMKRGTGNGRDEWESGEGNPIKQVLEGERFIRYREETKKITPQVRPYTGDLFRSRKKEDGKFSYYLNVRAQCSLRGEDPKLYLIKGEPVDTKKLMIKGRPFTKTGLHLPGSREEIPYGELAEVLGGEGNEERLGHLNNAIARGPRKAGGTLIGTATEVYVTCLDGESAIRFDLDIDQVLPLSKACETYNRLGRLIAPYITDIQHRCSNHIVRTGLFPTPSQALY